MSQASRYCVVCSILGRPDTWNGLDILVCPSCSLAWRATFDLPRDYYGSIQVDDENIKKIVRKRNSSDQLNALKKFLPPSHIYDVGCSDGWFLSNLREKGYRNCLGIEPGENGLKISKENGLDVFQGTLNDLPRLIVGRNIRALTLFHLLEHLDDPKEAMRVAHNSLPIGGVLVLETPDVNASIQKITDHKNHLVYPEHLFYWNEKSLRKLLENAGFLVVAIKRRSFDWRHAPISRSLLRLGLVRDGGKQNSHKNTTTVSSPDQVQNQKDKNSYFRTLIRFVLAHLVHFLRRDDYILIVAKTML